MHSVSTFNNRMHYTAYGLQHSISHILSNHFYQSFYVLLGYGSRFN